MITIINRAILHILDFNSGVTIFSEKELDVKNDNVSTYISKHIEKISQDSNSNSGNFFPESEFKKKLSEYLLGNLDFVNFSIYITEQFYLAIAASDKLDPSDLFICDVNIDTEQFIVILKCNNKVGFTHQVLNNEGKIVNEIINHYAILPNISQRIDEYVLININTLNIKYSDKQRFIDGQDTYVIPDCILKCTSSISQKNVVKLVQSITSTVSENHGQSSVAAVSMAKNYLLENAEVSDYLDPIELGKEVFSSSKIMQEEFVNEMKSAGVPEEVKLDRAYIIRKGKNHKIKTDTGIEITFPVDYFENKEYIEFINNPDGTISIELKNIGKLINK